MTPTTRILRTLPVLALGLAALGLVPPAFGEPPVTNGLALWLDASQIFGLGDGATVDTWPDMSGNANNAVRAFGAPTFQGNVLNHKAEAFYRRHGVVKIEPAAESGLDMRGRKVMTTKHCIKHQLGWCPKEKPDLHLAEPLALVDEQDNVFQLRFRCKECEMEVYFNDVE